MAGRLDRRGERLHVVATIGDGTHAFEASVSELPRLEREVARTIARALGADLPHGDDRALVRADTASPRAYDAFLRGRFEWNRWTDAGWRKAIEHFKEATIADPLFAAAYAGLSDAYALHLGVAGRAAEGVREAQRAVELNPISAIAHRALADLLQIVGDHPRYAAQARRFAGLHPADPISHYHLALSVQFLGREEEAFRHIRRYEEMCGIPPARLATYDEAFRRGGMRAYWQAVAGAEEAAGAAPITVAIAAALAGDRERTLAAIERGIDRHDAFILWARTYPMFVFLRDDPRYQALMAHLAPAGSRKQSSPLAGDEAAGERGGSRRQRHAERYDFVFSCSTFCSCAFHPASSALSMSDSSAMRYARSKA